MTTIVTRASKGAALTWTEGDANITNLNNDKIELTSLSVTTNSASGGGSLSYNNTNGTFTFTPADTTASVALDDITDVVLTTPSTGQVLSYNAGNWVNSAVTVGSIDDITDVVLTTPSNGQVLSYNNGNWVNSAASGGISNVVEDTTPQLGGELDGQGQTISNVNFKDYKETNYSLSYAATITPDVANGNVQTVTLTGNVTFNALGNPEGGQSLTLIIKQDATGNRTLSSTMLFAGGEKTLSTAGNSIDILSVFYDGTTYYASLAKGFA